MGQVKSMDADHLELAQHLEKLLSEGIKAAKEAKAKALGGAFVPLSKGVGIMLGAAAGAGADTVGPDGYDGRYNAHVPGMAVLAYPRASGGQLQGLALLSPDHPAVHNIRVSKCMLSDHHIYNVALKA
jgi:hypothetical protein